LFSLAIAPKEFNSIDEENPCSEEEFEKQQNYQTLLQQQLLGGEFTTSNSTSMEIEDSSSMPKFLEFRSTVKNQESLST